jgi:carbonic anhydrase/acetyltransferase-like protein (isoleucine patch superfamily)
MTEERLSPALSPGTLIALDGVAPRVAADAFIAPTAVLVGDVEVGAGASVWFGAVLRGDFGRIVIGPGSCVQDNAVIHAAETLPTLVGAAVTIGHMAMLEGCVVEDGAVIGMGAIVLQGATVGAGAMVAAGSVVTERQAVPDAVLAAGSPARVKKPLDGSSQTWVEEAAREYQDMRLRYLRGARRVA